jgi:hypothetical protein
MLTSLSVKSALKTGCVKFCTKRTVGIKSDLSRFYDNHGDFRFPYHFTSLHQGQMCYAYTAASNLVYTYHGAIMQLGLVRFDAKPLFYGGRQYAILRKILFGIFDMFIFNE